MGRGGCPGRAGGGGAVQKHSCGFLASHTSSAVWGEGGKISPPSPTQEVFQKRVLPREDSGKESSRAANWSPPTACSCFLGKQPSPQSARPPVLRGSSQPCTIPFGGPQPEAPIVGTQSLPHLLTPPNCCFVSFLPFLLPNTPASKQAAVDQPNTSASPLPGPWSWVLGPWGGTS